MQYRQIAIYLHHKSINHTNIQKVIDKTNVKPNKITVMKRFDLSEIMKTAHRNYKYFGKKQGKTFGEVLKATWRLAKIQVNFTPEAVKARTDKFLSERNEIMSKAAKAVRHEGYNNLNIPDSAYYNPYSTGKYGSHYVGD